MKACSVIVFAVAALTVLPPPAVAYDQIQQGEAQFSPFALKFADATHCVKKLRTLLGEGNGFTVFADEESNTVFIRAQPEEMQRAKAILARLDYRRLSREVTIIRLKKGEVARIAPLLQNILTLAAFIRDDPYDSIVYASADGTTVAVWGSVKTMQLARDILEFVGAVR
jgi:hypothetical protein